MSQLTIEGVGTFKVPAGTKLLNALVEHGGDPRYRCGGKPKYTVYRVEFISVNYKKCSKLKKRKMGGYCIFCLYSVRIFPFPVLYNHDRTHFLETDSFNLQKALFIHSKGNEKLMLKIHKTYS